MFSNPKDKKIEKNFIKNFRDFYRAHMPNTVYLVKNGERYDVIEKAVVGFINYIKSVSPNSIVNVERDSLIGTSICVYTKAQLYVFEDVKKLCESIAKADIVEIIPRTDDKVEINLSFKNAYKPAPPRSN